MSYLLFFSAVLPVFIVCFYVYKKDVNKEPLGLLLKIFFYGFLCAIPVVFIENILGFFFPTDKFSSFTRLFINVFFGVALVEEVFKWVVVKQHGYNSKEFDEIYDIIVYSVFSSLGFACIENILYVFNYGQIHIAVTRAIFSIPGHMCFGVLMGYYFAKTKLSNKSSSVYTTNLISSLLVPCIFHTLYDALLFYGTETSILIFYGFDFIMVVSCMIIINKMSKIQNNVKVGIENGILVKESNQVIVNSNSNVVNYCPVCGRKTDGGKYCGGCGFKLSD